VKVNYRSAWATKSGFPHRVLSYRTKAPLLAKYREKWGTQISLLSPKNHWPDSGMLEENPFQVTATDLSLS
jgi:hypothetical protein